jgi:putative DNA methylase
MTAPKTKLIEAALPLPEINDASAYDKMPGIGPHPKGIHHWWARLPLPTARAILFASVVDDPSAHIDRWPTEEAQNAERERLFDIIRKMMGKKMHEHPETYNEARAEMLKHCEGKLPAVFDPFAGGGSIPLEACRLGFDAYAGDLNPVAVLLNKCNLELTPRWIGRHPVNPDDRKKIGGAEPWHAASGLAADVRSYARLVRERAEEELAHLYPNVPLARELGGGEANVVAWIWARTVASPNPTARGMHVPLISTYWLSNKKGSETWLEAIIDKGRRTYRFEVRTGAPKDRAVVGSGTKLGNSGFRCLLTDDPIPFSYVRDEGRRGRLGVTLLAVVAERARGRAYVGSNSDQINAAQSANPSGFPETDLPDEALGFRVQNYGFKQHWQMFTPRQLSAMTTASDLIKRVASDIRRDATSASLGRDDADAYARTVVTFLGLALDRCADFNNAFCRWSSSNQKVMNLFGQPIVRMVWDFAEANFLGDSVGGWATCSDYVADCIEVIPVGSASGNARQIDAATGANGLRGLIVSTDPPYYDNIGYAALSDFFYVWLRRTIGDNYPDLFSTVLVPKIPELTASPERFEGDKEKAKTHFESGFRKAFAALLEKIDPRFPLTVYYAFKQADEESGAEQNSEDGSSTQIDLTTGWETLLDSLIASGFQITGTWPVRASQAWRLRAMGANALASYIVLASRARPAGAPQTDRRSFVAELKKDLPLALRHLQQGNVAPVDFAQAAIGPGMSIFSRYARVLESTGNPMSVRTALSLINQSLTEVLSQQDDEFDPDTRWAIAWFEQHGFGEGDFGEAEILSKAKVTAVAGLQQAGIVLSKKGKVRLLRPEELPREWDPVKDRRLAIWEMTHHLVRVYFQEKAGDERTADLLRKLGSRGEIARDLAYRLFDVCEKKKRSQEAQAYNALVLGWSEIARLARESGGSRGEQAQMF